MENWRSLRGSRRLGGCERQQGRGCINTRCYLAVRHAMRIETIVYCGQRICICTERSIRASIRVWQILLDRHEISIYAALFPSSSALPIPPPNNSTSAARYHPIKHPSLPQRRIPLKLLHSGYLLALLSHPHHSARSNSQTEALYQQPFCPNASYHNKVQSPTSSTDAQRCTAPVPSS